MSNGEVAREVIKGMWGVGRERKTDLKKQVMIITRFKNSLIRC